MLDLVTEFKHRARRWASWPPSHLIYPVKTAFLIALLFRSLLLHFHVLFSSKCLRSFQFPVTDFHLNSIVWKKNCLYGCNYSKFVKVCSIAQGTVYLGGCFTGTEKEHISTAVAQGLEQGSLAIFFLNQVYLWIVLFLYSIHSGFCLFVCLSPPPKTLS